MIMRTHTRTHERKRTRSRSCSRKRTNARVRTYTQTHAHARTHTHTRTRTHAHKRVHTHARGPDARRLRGAANVHSRVPRRSRMCAHRRWRTRSSSWPRTSACCQNRQREARRLAHLLERAGLDNGTGWPACGSPAPWPARRLDGRAHSRPTISPWPQRAGKRTSTGIREPLSGTASQSAPARALCRSGDTRVQHCRAGFIISVTDDARRARERERTGDDAPRGQRAAAGTGKRHACTYIDAHAARMSVVRRLLLAECDTGRLLAQTTPLCLPRARRAPSQQPAPATRRQRTCLYQTALPATTPYRPFDAGRPCAQAAAAQDAEATKTMAAAAHTARRADGPDARCGQWPTSAECRDGRWSVPSAASARQERARACRVRRAVAGGQHGSPACQRSRHSATPLCSVSQHSAITTSGRTCS